MLQNLKSKSEVIIKIKKDIYSNYEYIRLSYTESSSKSVVNTLDSYKNKGIISYYKSQNSLSIDIYVNSCYDVSDTFNALKHDIYTEINKLSIIKNKLALIDVPEYIITLHTGRIYIISYINKYFGNNIEVLLSECKNKQIISSYRQEKSMNYFEFNIAHVVDKDVVLKIIKEILDEIK